MWTYHIATGQLDDPNGKFAGTGYSGAAGATRNNPLSVSMQGEGPIPPGEYRIGRPYDHQHLGPCTMNLDLIEGDTFGRSAFRIHGDNAIHDASHGCVILGPAIRQQIAASGDTVLRVVPS